ncbi:MAG: hypothetical protein ACYC7F_13090, partial [Gemmatimonadaceae bacterium]
TGAPAAIAMADLGLDTAHTYVAFDFWSDRALGAVKTALTLAPVAENDVQVVCLREQVDHPQLLSTNRHVTCGGADLKDVHWDGSALTGVVKSVAGETLVIAVTEPPGWEAVAVESPDAQAQLGDRMEPNGADGLRWRKVHLDARTASTTWTIRYRHVP